MKKIISILTVSIFLFGTLLCGTSCSDDMLDASDGQGGSGGGDGADGAWFYVDLGSTGFDNTGGFILISGANRYPPDMQGFNELSNSGAGAKNFFSWAATNSAPTAMTEDEAKSKGWESQTGSGAMLYIFVPGGTTKTAVSCYAKTTENGTEVLGG